MMIAISVVGGVLAATLFGLVFAPAAFYAVASLTHGRRRLAELRRKRAQRHTRHSETQSGSLDKSSLT